MHGALAWGNDMGHGYGARAWGKSRTRVWGKGVRQYVNNKGQAGNGAGKGKGTYQGHGA